MNGELSVDEANAVDAAIEHARELDDHSRAGLRGSSRPPAHVGAYLAGLTRHAPPDADDPELVAAAQAGNAAAREALIERHVPMIVAAARGYRVEGLELADLVQEGIVGLLRALGRYDATRGVPFSAYAQWWTRQAMQDLRSDFVRPMRLPPKALRQLAQLKSVHGRIYAAEGREASLTELASMLDLESSQVDALVRADARARSLDEPLEGGEGEIGVLGDLLEDPVSADDYEEVLDAIAGEQLHTLLATLNERERDIVNARFGLDGRPSRSLSAIGEGMGISTERVRQLESRALAKLRQAA